MRTQCDINTNTHAYASQIIQIVFLRQTELLSALHPA
jgi:hypothetical protein